MNQLDLKNSTRWAIAGLAGAGAIINVNFFDLVNLDTGRAHLAILTSGGISGGLGEILLRRRLTRNLEPPGRQILRTLTFLGHVSLPPESV